MLTGSFRSALQHIPNNPAQHHHPPIHLFTPGFSKTDTDEMPVIATRRKDAPGHDGDMMLHRFGAEPESVYFFIELYPEYKSSLRAGNLGVFREMLDDGLHITETLRVQSLAQVFKVIFITPVLQEMRHGGLGEGGGTDIVHPLDQFHFLNEFSREHPADTVTRR